MAQQGDDPTSKPEPNGRRTQPPANGEFRTLGMRLLNSAHRHIRRYSAATNQPVAPLPSSWRSAASEPLVWSGGSSSTPGQQIPPPVNPVDADFEYQPLVPTDAPISGANPAEIQREPAPAAPAPRRPTIEQQLME